MNSRTAALLVVAVVGIAPLGASTHIDVSLAIGVPAPVVVRQAPPAPLVERVVVAPGQGYVWVAGHHAWRGRWVWVPGVWIQPPQPRAIWVAGRWEAGTGAWIEGHWEIPAVAVATPAGPAPVVVAQVSPAPEVIVYSPPPPPRRERRGHAPGRGYVWVSGYWVFRGGQHVWVTGRWDRPPTGYHRWVDARWERRGGNYVFVEGCWR